MSVSRDFIVIVGALVISVTWFMLKVLVPKKSLDEPSPKNNWRVRNRGREETSFGESGAGFGGGDGVSH